MIFSTPILFSHFFTPVFFKISPSFLFPVYLSYLVFNVLYTDDDSWIAVETPVDQIFMTGETNKELAAMSQLPADLVRCSYKV